MRPSPTGLTEGPFLPKARHDTERLDMRILNSEELCRVQMPFYKGIRELGTSMLRSTQSTTRRRRDGDHPPAT